MAYKCITCTNIVHNFLGEKCKSCEFKTTAVTSHRCDKHREFWSTGGKCKACERELSEKDWSGLIPEALSKQFDAPTQSARYNTGKTQVRELDPAFIMGLGEVLTASRQKYDEGNWMKETKFSTPYESAMRHLMKFWSGEEFDEETSKHHLLHAATNLMFLYYHTRSDVGIDDRLFKKDKK